MKKFMISFMIFFSFIAIALIVLMIIAINRGGINMNYKPSKAKLVNTQTIDLDEIDSISIKYHSDNVIFYTSDTNELILKEYKSFTPDKEDLASITKSGNQLNIQGERLDVNSLLFSFNYYSRAEIYLPSQYVGELSISTTSGNIVTDQPLKLEVLEASSTSGDIKVNEVYAKDINISSASGNIIIEKAEGNRSFSSTSGDIKVFNGIGDSDASSTSGNIIIENSNGQLEVNTSSGDIKINDSIGKKDIETNSGRISLVNSTGFTAASASSGDINIKALSGAGNYNTTSGNIKIELSTDINTLEDNININASSGDVTLTLPSTLEYNFNANTSSGDIRTYFDDMLKFNKKGNQANGSVGENPNIDVKINTTSGNIRINED